MCKHMHRGPFASGRGMQRGSHLQHDELCKEAATYIRARYAKRQPFTAGRGYAKKYECLQQGEVCKELQPFASGRGMQRGSHLQHGEVCKEAAVYSTARYANRQYGKVYKEAAIYIRARYTKRYNHLLQGEVCKCSQ